MSAFPYSEWVAAAVHGAKYEGEKDRARFLGAVLSRTSAAPLLEDADAVVPVPMYRRREQERGYNQVMEMAAQACIELGKPAPQPLLVQHEERASQVGLSARQRRTNVRGSFSLNSEIAIPAGRRIVVVDDVRTTGSTLLACTEALRPLRPASIDVVTLAAELSIETMEHLGLPRRS